MDRRRMVEKYRKPDVGDGMERFEKEMGKARRRKREVSRWRGIGVWEREGVDCKRKGR